MNPDDVPIELRKLAVAAMNANDALPEDDQDMTPDHILAAVLPAHKATVRAQTIRDLEAGRITPEEIAAVGCMTSHLVNLREDGWTIKHPLSCRPHLFDCPINVAAVRDLLEPPDQLGVYTCELDADGRFVIGQLDSTRGGA